MKLHRFSFPCLAITTAAALTAFARILTAAPEPAEASVATATNAAPVLSLSVFDAAGPQIKDPFYPRSTRRAFSVATTTNAAAVSVSSFVWKGVSGSEGHRLALINNRTLAEGESSEVTTAAGNKVKIRCLKIKEDSVLIRVENQSEPIELRFEDRTNSKIKLQY